MAESIEKEFWLKRVLPHTFLGRSLLIILTPLVLLQVISTWIFYDRHYSNITKRLAQGLAGDIAATIRIMDRNPTPLEMAQAFRMAERAMWLKLSFEEGAVIEDATRAPYKSLVEEKLARAFAERFKYPFYIDREGDARLTEIQIQRHDGILKVIVRDNRLFSSTTYIFIMWMIGAGIILFGVAIIFMRNQVRPIQRLARAAENFGKGRDPGDFKPEGATEVRQAAAAFLMMRERIHRQVQQRTAMLAGVSHDLRTPLTRMKLQLAMLGDSTEIANLSSDVAEMEHMVEGYLAFARGEGAERPVACDLGPIVSEVVESMRHLDASIDLHIEEKLPCIVQPNAIRRCLTNLLSNACRYANHIDLRAGQRKNAIEVVIDDDGPGIPEAQREEVFKPFSRIDSSRNPETGGTGLGLTIALDVARNHGGDIRLEESPSGGLRARLVLPI